MRILVVEDQKKVAQALKEGLGAEHYEVDIATTGEDGFFQVSSQTYDLVLLDLMLHGRSGIDILKAMDTPQLLAEIRQIAPESPLNTPRGQQWLQGVHAAVKGA